MTPIVQIAHQNDIAGINALSVDLGYALASDKIAFDRINKIITSPNDKLWICKIGDEVVGWIHLFIANRVASDSFTEIGGLVVATQHRRKGIGKLLVEEVVEFSKKINLKVRVRCNAKRTEAHQFYHSMGFINRKSQYIFERTQ